MLPTTPIAVVVVVMPMVPMWVVIIRVTRIIAIIRRVIAVVWPVVARNTESKTEMYSSLGLSRRPGNQAERGKR